MARFMFFLSGQCKSVHGFVLNPSSEASDCMVKQPENLKSFVQQWARSSDGAWVVFFSIWHCEILKSWNVFEAVFLVYTAFDS